MPFHLLLPLTSSMLLVVGLLCIKVASKRGVSPWTPTFIANQFAAMAFSFLWLLGGDTPQAELLWQPAVIAAFYILGQVCTFLAISQGDVSVATPIFGVKVLIVPAMLWLTGDATITPTIWWGAALSLLGIWFVQRTMGEGEQNARQLSLTISLAVLTAFFFASFDICVQRWAPSWGPGRLLPIVYWMVAVLSLVFLPAVQFHALREPATRHLLIMGSALVAVQALGIVYTLGQFWGCRPGQRRLRPTRAVGGSAGLVGGDAVGRKRGGTTEFRHAASPRGCGAPDHGRHPRRHQLGEKKNNKLA